MSLERLVKSRPEIRANLIHGGSHETVLPEAMAMTLVATKLVVRETSNDEQCVADLLEVIAPEVGESPQHPDQFLDNQRRSGMVKVVGCDNERLDGTNVRRLELSGGEFDQLVRCACQHFMNVREVGDLDLSADGEELEVRYTFTQLRSDNYLVWTG